MSPQYMIPGNKQKCYQFRKLMHLFADCLNIVL